MGKAQRQITEPRRMITVAAVVALGVCVVLGVASFSKESEAFLLKEITESFAKASSSQENLSAYSLSPSSSLSSKNTSASSYKLALAQSGGFFDDIPDHHWKRLREIAHRTFPNHYTKDLQKYSNHPKKLYSNWWNAENFQEEFHCQFSERLPADSNGDGPKWVCDPHRIAAQPQGCLVYSVGSNGNVQFEKAIQDQISKDCEIHTFDFITQNKRNGNFAQALKGYATFHNWGLGTPIQAASNKKFKTLAQTVKALGHEGRRIDVFKIDCEQCEWYTYKQWLRTNVVELKQILVETHNVPMPYARDFFFDLHNAGYVIFSKEANYQNGGGGVEFAFLRLSKEFWESNDNSTGGSLYDKATYPNIKYKKVNY